MIDFRVAGLSRPLPEFEGHFYLVAANYVLNDVPDLAALEKRFAYRYFSHFIKTWSWKNRFLRDYDENGKHANR